MFDIAGAISSELNILSHCDLLNAQCELSDQGYIRFYTVMLMLNYSHERYCERNFSKDSYIYLNYICESDFKSRILFGFKHCEDYMQFWLTHQ